MLGCLSSRLLESQTVAKHADSIEGSSRQLGNLTAQGPLDDIVDGIRSGKTRKIVACVGAGISVSAGIPDFRTPGTGLYDNLQKYDLPYPEVVFDIDYFSKKPEAFCALAMEMWPSNISPTPTHHFFRLLQEKQMLQRLYTQNIDTLERKAGIRPELLVEAHGSFATACCVNRRCRTAKTSDWFKDQLTAGEVPRCDKCGDLVKPDIVFFGEELPKRFEVLLRQDFTREQPDLLIVAGTSLQVYPFAGLPSMARCPRLLINREVPDNFEATSSDAVLLGECDECFRTLASLLGWLEDLDGLISGDGQSSRL